MPRQLFGGRVSTSTAVIALVFVVTLATYLLVRPVPASFKQSKPPVPVQPLWQRSAAPRSTTRPWPRSSLTPKPAASSSPTAAETRRPGSASPSAPAPSTSSAAASEKPSRSAEPSR